MDDEVSTKYAQEICLMGNMNGSHTLVKFARNDSALRKGIW